MKEIIAFIVAYLDGKPEVAAMLSTESQVCFNFRKCYDAALGKWSQGNGWRARISSHRFADLESLRIYLAEYRADFDFGLLNLFASELNDNRICADYISSRMRSVDSGDAMFRSISDGKNYFRPEPLPASEIRRGLIKHQQVGGYIRRYCSMEQENFRPFYLKEDSDRFTLLDYVTDVAASNCRKFILYSGAQTGKTTELKNLCWELQQSGAYLPISFEVRTCYDLKIEQLPRNQYIDNKEAVVIIDALDEVNGPEREELILAIKSYAHDNPDIRMVLSCRSNYRRDDTFADFKDVFLLGMSSSDIAQYIRECLGETDFINQICDYGLNEFLQHPFFLNILIEAYRNNRKLPTSRSEIYRLFIENSFNTECSKNSSGAKICSPVSPDESLGLLKRIALSMSLMCKQSLSDRDMLKCVYNEPKNIGLCKRFGILSYEDNCYSFSHNAIREWLVASYLFEQGLEKARIISSYPNGTIKPDWHNIIILWISMYGKEDSDKVRPIIEWLEKSCLELIIHADADTLGNDNRENIFKGVVLQYKLLGIRIGSILSDEYARLVKFCQTPGVIKFITSELKESKINTVYYSDLMGICSQIDWTALKHSDINAFKGLMDAIDEKLAEKLKCEPNGDITYFVLENDFFASRDYVQKYFSMFSESDNYEVIKCMMEMIARAGAGDNYIDYILEKEKYIHDQHRHNCTTCVSRFEVYKSLGTVESYEGIKKILAHEFPDHFAYHSLDWEFYCRMMEKCLSAAAGYINDGRTDLIPLVKDKYLELFDSDRNHNSRDNDTSSISKSFRRLYRDSGLDKQEKDVFKKKMLDLFRKKASYETIHSEYVLATAWMTKDDVEEIYNNLDVSDDDEVTLVRWLEDSPDEEVRKIAEERNALILPVPEGIRQSRLRRERNFADLASYGVFKSQVLEFINNNSNKVKPFWSGDNGDDINDYVVRFCNHFIGDDDLYNASEIISAVNDESYYDSYFMKMVYESLSTRNSREIPGEYLTRCFKKAEETVARLAAGYGRVYHGTDAIKMLLAGCIKVSDKVLTGLLPFSNVSISRFDFGNFGHTHSLFEFITDNISVNSLANPLVDYITQNIHNIDNNILDFANYIVNNRIAKGYDILLEYIESDEAYSTSVAGIFIEKGECIGLIKSISDSLDMHSRLCIYSELIRNADDSEWVLKQLEPIFTGLEGYDLTEALKLLLASGSMDALSYILNHIDAIDYRHSFIFNYNNRDAATMLVTILGHLHSISAPDYLYFNSIFNSLERIAVQDIEALNDVKSALKSLVGKDEKYKYINRYIISFEQKYYESKVRIGNIDEVINLIDGTACVNAEAPARAGAEVYVSYNWEVPSDCMVDYLCFVLEINHIDYCRDKTNCSYRDNIKEFMMAIHNGHYIVVFLGKPYLKSQNCMFELTGIMQHDDYKNRILPIVVDDTVRTRNFYVELCKYWHERREEISSCVDDLVFDEKLAEPLKEELETVNKIIDFLPKIKDYIDWTNAQSLTALSGSQFKPLIDIIKGQGPRPTP